MQTDRLHQIIEASTEIRQRYHNLEEQFHGSKWRVEEDALAFLTDAGLVGRMVMAQQGRWPTGEEIEPELRHKLSECIWWCLALAQRMGIDMESELPSWLDHKLSELHR